MTGEWKMHFHRTISGGGGTKELDVYSLRREPNSFVTIMVDHKDTEHLAQLVIRKLNENPQADLPTNETLEIYGMFHGPWRTEERTGVRYIAFSDDEARRVKHAVFRLAAELTSVEHQYATLLSDFARLEKYARVMQQELLRLRGRVETAPRDQTIADLLELPDDGLEDRKQLEIPDMACRKDIVQNRRT